jgi:hypothetical protein
MARAGRPRRPRCSLGPERAPRPAHLRDRAASASRASRRRRRHSATATSRRPWALRPSGSARPRARDGGGGNRTRGTLPPGHVTGLARLDRESESKYVRHYKQHQGGGPQEVDRRVPLTRLPLEQLVGSNRFVGPSYSFCGSRPGTRGSGSPAASKKCAITLLYCTSRARSRRSESRAEMVG